MRFTDRPAVPRRIVGFHQDEEGHWVADLDCGHGQHVRHEPPLQSRPWVHDADGRAARVGTELWCVRCVDLAAAFDAALRQVERALGDDMRTLAGASARPELERLRADLHAQRAAALAEGGVDPAWVRRTVRRVVEWTPETELPLVAALGMIARAGPRAPDA